MMLELLRVNINVMYNVDVRLGGKAGATVRCPTCNGRGMKVTMRQLGPGMVQQLQSVCPECRGEGTIIHKIYGLTIRPLIIGLTLLYGLTV